MQTTPTKTLYAQDTQHFAPSVRLPNGQDLTPPGWMWIMGYALAGCAWAISIADTPKFRQEVSDWQNEHARAFSFVDNQIARLKAAIAAKNAGNEHVSDCRTPLESPQPPLSDHDRQPAHA